MKKTRLKEIIKEEIQNILSEMPVYNVTDREGFDKAYKEFKDSNIKNTPLNIILDKLKDTGEVDTRELAAQAGKDPAAFNDWRIRAYLNPKEDEVSSNPKLIPFSDYVKVQSSRKPKPEKEKSSTPKPPKKSTSDKQDRPSRKMSDMDDEDKEAFKSGESDEVVKTVKNIEGDEEIETKLNDVIKAKKIKLKKSKKGSLEYEKELAGLKQFLDNKNIKKYINKKIVKGSTNPYSISSILKDIE
jgi:hypothetical protein